MIRYKSLINTAALSKKYKCDVSRIIRLWKKEKNDFEISQNLGVDTIKLLQIRQDIAYQYEKERQRRLKNSGYSNMALTDKRS